MLERLAAATFLAANEVDGASVDERQDPRARLRALGKEAVGGAPDAEERVLDCVLRQRVVAQDSQREAVRHATEPVVELGKRLLVGARDERDQSLVRDLREVAAAGGRVVISAVT